MTTLPLPRGGFNQRDPAGDRFRALFREADARAWLEAGEDCQLAREFPYVPLAAPGMPHPGHDFVLEAELLVAGALAALDAEIESLYETTAAGRRQVVKQKGARAELARLKVLRQAAVRTECDLLYWRALYDRAFRLTLRLKRRVPESVPFVPGHYWGHGPTRAGHGPVPKPPGEGWGHVYVLGKNPGKAEDEQGYNLVGPSGRAFDRLLTAGGARGHGRWYVANACRFGSPDAPRGDATLQAAWLGDCLPLFHAELRLLRPAWVVALGNEAIKMALGPRQNLKTSRGRVFDAAVPLPEHLGGGVHAFRVVTATHPARAEHDPAAAGEVAADTSRAWAAVSGRPPVDFDAGRLFCVLHSQAELDALVDRLLAEGVRHFAVDLEWEGRFPDEPGAYLRTAQFAWGPKAAAVIALQDEGGGRHFQGDDEGVKAALRRLWDRDGVRLVGHYFAADAPRLVHWGLGFVLARFAPPKGPDGPFRTRDEGGFDTILAVHAVDETTKPMDLESVGIRQGLCRRYSAALEDFLTAYCARNKLKRSELKGYGCVPNDLLWEYAWQDAAVTYRLFERYNGTPGRVGLLDLGEFGESSRVPFHNAMAAWPAFVEATIEGLVLDTARAETIRQDFGARAEELLAEIKAWARWPDFNPRSVYHVRELLFGEELNGKADPLTGALVRLRPDKARTLGLVPYKTSGSKKAKLWAEVCERQQAHLYDPSTDSESLIALAPLHPLVGKLRDYRVVRQVTTTIFHDPEEDDAGNPLADPETGELVYAKGVQAYVAPDGRVHTNYSQTKETGRASSWGPPMMNWSKKKEKEFKRVMGDRYRHSLRSAIVAPPGWCLITNDWTAAEVLLAAVASGDPKLLEHARRSSLREDDPDYFDIHCNVAVQSFGLDVPPSKKAFEEAGLGFYRDAAKTRFFGWFYGQGTLAAWRKIKENCPEASITPEDVERLTVGLQQAYPVLHQFFQDAYRRVREVGLLTNLFGGHRRFRKAREASKQAEQEREGANFLIQGGVARAMSTAMANVVDYRRERPELVYKVVLQVHDDLMLACPLEHARDVYLDVVPACMVDRVPLVPCDFDGVPRGDGPYYFGLEQAVQLRWGEKLPADVAARYGLRKEDLEGARR
jgi:uracil-DNA glycosylase family 4